MDPFLTLRFRVPLCFSPVSAKLSPWSRASSEELKGPQLVVKKFPRVLYKLMVHYRVHNRPPPVLNPSQSNTVHAPILRPEDPL